MTARVFTVTLHRSRQQQMVTAHTAGELADILCAHYPGEEAIRAATAAWYPESLGLMIGLPPTIVQEVKA